MTRPSGVVPLPRTSCSRCRKAPNSPSPTRSTATAISPVPPETNDGSQMPVLWVPNRVPGDANFNRTVAFDDLLMLAQHYGGPGEWVDGDFNMDGKVDFSDLLIVAQNYGQSTPA